MKMNDVKRAKAECIPSRLIKRIVSALATLIFGLTLSGCSGGVVHALTQEEIVISSFSEERVDSIAVALDTSADMIGLPSTLTANIVVNGQADEEEISETDSQETPAIEILEVREIPVAWECATYDSETAGEYIFTALLEAGYTFEGELPKITVEVLTDTGDSASDEADVVEGSEDTASAEADALEESEDSASAETDEIAESAETPEPSVTPEPSATPEPSVTPEAEATSDSTLDSVITAFLNEPIEIYVGRGTPADEIPLPATLPALNGNGAQIEVPVVWTNVCDEESEYDPNDYAAGALFGYGPWIFTAAIAAPQPAETVISEDGETAEVQQPTYSYAGDPVTASVGIYGCTQIDSFCGISSDGLLMRFVILTGGAIDLPDYVSAFMADGGFLNIPVSWNGSFNVNSAGVYTLNMVVGGGYSGGGGAYAEIDVVKESSAAIESNSEDANSAAVIVLD